MTVPPRPRDRRDFEVALICALQLESDAVEAAFDGYWADEGAHLGKAQGDQNSYTTGWICGHNVVLAYMARMGKVDAASVSASLRMSFPAIRLCLLVGICGGVPTGSGKDEILLGDILISSTVVQFDFGSRYSDQFVVKDTIDEAFGKPSQELRSFLHQISGKRGMKRLKQKTSIYLQELCALEDFEDSKHPGIDSDSLYPPDYRHKHQDPTQCEVCARCTDWEKPVCEIALKATCEQLGCDPMETLPRRRVQDLLRNAAHSGNPSARASDLRESSVETQPMIYFGAIGSSDMVMKSGRIRDKVAAAKDIIGFEMEGAGVSRNMPTLVVKGVCDYADSHKNKDWQKYAAAASAACMKSLLSAWQSSTVHTGRIEIQTHTTRATKTMSKSEKNCLRSLFFPDMDFRMHDINNPEPETCQWLERHSYYQTWQQNQHGLLWIRGKPGAGKSTLLKHEELRCRQAFASEEGHIVASFFFHGRGSALQNSSQGLFRALLHQLLIQIPQALQRLSKVFQTKCDTQGEHGSSWEWHVKELQDFLEMVILNAAEVYQDGATIQRTIHLYIDALDEAGKETAVDLVAYFQRLVSRTVTSPNNLLICFTCRHYPVVALNTGLTINLEQQNHQDIETYVERQLKEEMTNKFEATTVGRTIVAKSNGVFQWVYLVVRRIRSLHVEGAGLQRIFRTIEEVPLGLHALYGNLLESINESELSESKSLLRWVCYAFRPLEPWDLLFALGLDIVPLKRFDEDCRDLETFCRSKEEAKRRINTLSAGLVEIKESRVQVIHQSVRDYLTVHAPQHLICLQDTTSPPNSSIHLQVHSHLARLCIAVLLLDDFSGEEWKLYGGSGLGHIGFWRYAIDFWSRHVERANPENMLRLFGWPFSPRLGDFVASVDRGRDNNAPAFPANLLHLCASYGLFHLGDFLMKGDGKDYIKDRDLKGRTAFYLAIQRGHLRLAQRLIQAEEPTQSSKGPSMLYTVDNPMNVPTGLTPHSSLLPSNTIDNSDDNHETAYCEYYGQHNEGGDENTPADALMDPPINGGHVNITRGDEGTPRLVPAHCTLVNLADNEGCTPISRAANLGILASVKFLLQRDDVLLNVTDINGRTALSLAVMSQHTAIVKLLLARKEVRVNVADSAGRTPISHAAGRANVEIVRILLGRDDVLINSIDSAGCSPIFYAAAGGQLETVRILFESDRDLVDEADSTKTPQQPSTAPGLSVNRADLAGWALPFSAAIPDIVEIVRLLLARSDMLVNLVDSVGRTPLFYAIKTGRLDIVRQFLERKDVHLNVVDFIGQTPIHCAVRWGRNEVAQLLLSRNDIDVNVIDLAGRTPLTYAAASASAIAFDSCRVLLQTGRVQINLADKEGHTALYWAQRSGTFSSIALLKKNGASMEPSQEAQGEYIPLEEHGGIKFIIESDPGDMHRRVLMIDEG